MAYNICEKCKREISQVDEVVCSNCGKTYHSFCWKSIPNCIECGSFNSDYAKSKVEKAINNEEVVKPAKQNINYLGKECMVCGSNMTETDWIVACPDCGMPYHKECWDEIDECSRCGIQPSNVTPVNINRSESFAVSNNSASYSSNNSGMFANIGEKIKGVATFFTIVGIVIGIIICIAMSAVDESMFWAGLLTGGMVALVSWISSFVLYGFGALISSVQSTEELLYEVLDKIKK